MQEVRGFSAYKRARLGDEKRNAAPEGAFQQATSCVTRTADWWPGRRLDWNASSGAAFVQRGYQRVTGESLRASRAS